MAISTITISNCEAGTFGFDRNNNSIKTEIFMDTDKAILNYDKAVKFIKAAVRDSLVKNGLWKMLVEKNLEEGEVYDFEENKTFVEGPEVIQYDFEQNKTFVEGPEDEDDDQTTLTLYITKAETKSLYGSEFVIKFKYIEDGEHFSAIHFNGEYRVKLETHICV